MITVRAPASIANLGPGFDCAAVAVELWNELEISEGSGVEIEGEDADELPRDDDHLALRAFSLLAPTDGLRFSFKNGIPVGRGLGSSAATVALGLVAGALVTGRMVNPALLLPLGQPLEGHADNLAAALAGGVCFSWGNGDCPRFARIATRLPLVPLAVVPEERVETVRSRRALPAAVPHADAAFTAARAALLGAALARGDAALFAAALEDRVHEPYRSSAAPLLRRLREVGPEGAAGVTLAGAGPAVVVWVWPRNALSAKAILERVTDACVLELAVTPHGACGT